MKQEPAAGVQPAASAVGAPRELRGLVRVVVATAPAKSTAINTLAGAAALALAG